MVGYLVVLDIGVWVVLLLGIVEVVVVVYWVGVLYKDLKLLNVLIVDVEGCLWVWFGDFGSGCFFDLDCLVVLGIIV